MFLVVAVAAAVAVVAAAAVAAAAAANYPFVPLPYLKSNNELAIYMSRKIKQGLKMVT